MDHPTITDPAPPPAARVPAPAAGARAGLGRALAAGCVLGAALACLTELARVTFGPNFHPVVPGRLYRSAQPTGPRLEGYADRHGIRTVVSLRGPQHKGTWLAEARAAQARGLSLEVVSFSPSRLPAPTEVRRLVEAFDRSEPPVLIHCREGADRTGLAATTYLLLYTDTDLAAARRQYSLRFGHVSVGPEAAVGQFFDRYAAWLGERGEAHTPARFRQWATAEYCPGPYRARLELVSAPDRVAAGRPARFVVRAHNTSQDPWTFRAGGTGFRAEYAVAGPDGEPVWRDRAGLLDRTVRPGESIELVLAVPAPPAAGRHRLFVHLVGPDGTFSQYGSEPLTYAWTVR